MLIFNILFVFLGETKDNALHLSVGTTTTDVGDYKCFVQLGDEYKEEFRSLTDATKIELNCT